MKEPLWLALHLHHLPFTFDGPQDAGPDAVNGALAPPAEASRWARYRAGG